MLFDQITELIDEVGVESLEVTKLVKHFTIQRDWSSIYRISEYVGREISILIDAKYNIFIDWGSISRVSLTPPVGAELPFKLWLHTHPRNNAYWSETDRFSLSISKNILERAIVLGTDGKLCSQNSKLLQSGSLLEETNIWTKEKVKAWL